MTHTVKYTHINTVSVHNRFLYQNTLQQSVKVCTQIHTATSAVISRSHVVQLSVSSKSTLIQKWRRNWEEQLAKIRQKRQLQ